jgi:predicted HicB family RNase H-like nuclease
MAKQKKEASPTSNFPKKWAKILDNLDPSDKFIDTVQQSTHDELDKIIVQCNEHMAEVKKDMDADQDLAEKKQAVKDAAAQYKEGIAVNEAKAMYCVYIKNSL